MTAVTHLTCEHRVDPLGIDVGLPRFSWRLASLHRGARQTAYRITVWRADHEASDGGGDDTPADLWDSGRVESDQSVLVDYDGIELTSRQRARWQVTVWDEAGRELTSDVATFELGLLEPDDWQAEWIGAALQGGPRTGVPAPYVRKAFDLDKSAAVASARLYVTALGLYEATINGQVVGDDVFTPGWTDYRKRVQYQVYDVTSLLRAGENAIGAVIGDGWAAGHVGMAARQNYVDRPRFLAQLEVTLADGDTVVVATDGTWRHQFGPLLANDFLHGEDYDARLELNGWAEPGYDDSGWLPVTTFADHGATRVATNGPTVRRVDELTPVGEPVNKGDFMSPRWILDFGQNLAGRVRFHGRAHAGTTVRFRFAEVLAEDGKLYIDNLRSARATDHYTFRGDPAGETWEPKFTFHGFRYVEMSGYPGPLAPDTVTAVAIHSDLTPTGTFSCSDPRLDQLQHNIVWSQKGNYLDVPTDCPQRDERLGWTGDAQVFARTAAFNFDVAGFMTKWATDLADTQTPEGAVPPVVPKVVLGMPDGGPVWADAAIICPYTSYLSYGDRRILEANYEVMTRYLDWVLDQSPVLIRCAPDYRGWHGFGDWLSINADTPRDLIGTAFLAYDLQLMATVAAVIGRGDDEARYRSLLAETKAAFGTRFLAKTGEPGDAGGPSVDGRVLDAAAAAALADRMATTDAIARGNLEAVDYGPIESKVFDTELFTPTQTSYVLALHVDLLPDDLRPVAVSELVADIERRDGHLSTGFVGASYLPHVLSAHGRLDVAYALLEQTSWPSWLYPVTQGATTIWERWDGWTEASGYQDADMNSFNHYAYGAIGAWMYQIVAGIDIDPLRPGYKHSVLRPQPGGSLTRAAATLTTPYGDLASKWSTESGAFVWDVVVPPNTTATAELPGSPSRVELDGQLVDGSVHELVAGTYRFVAT